MMVRRVGGRGKGSAVGGLLCVFIWWRGLFILICQVIVVSSEARVQLVLSTSICLVLIMTIAILSLGTN